MEFSDRLQEILSFYGLNASSFADRVAVGRSSISHLLSGRNKPSLEFVMSVLKEFPEVTLNWLVDGLGTFPSTQHKTVHSPTLQNSMQELPATALLAEEKNVVDTKEPTLFDNPKIQETEVPVTNNLGKNISKVILLYTDGSFSSYEPNL